MATWTDLERAEPELAAFGAALLYEPGPDNAGLAFLATVREDGGPRVHPLCVYPVAGSIYISVERQSPKHADLQRDPRYMLHAYPSMEGDNEFSVRGRVRFVTDAQERERLKDLEPRLVGEQAPHVYELVIERADSTRWEGWPNPGMYPVRRRWIAP